MRTARASCSPRAVLPDGAALVRARGRHATCSVPALRTNEPALRDGAPIRENCVHVQEKYECRENHCAPQRVVVARGRRGGHRRMRSGRRRLRIGVDRQRAGSLHVRDRQSKANHHAGLPARRGRKAASHGLLGHGDRTEQGLDRCPLPRRFAGEFAQFSAAVWHHHPGGRTGHRQRHALHSGIGVRRHPISGRGLGAAHARSRPQNLPGLQLSADGAELGHGQHPRP